MLTVFTTKEPRNLNLCFKVNGRLRNVVFSTPVLYGNIGVSTFATHDDDLAQAMKEHYLFNSVYYIKEEIADAPKEEKKMDSIESHLSDPATAMRNETVTTKQMAIAFIQGTFGDTFSAPNMSVEEMKREAARRWNVLFVKWGN